MEQSAAFMKEEMDKEKAHRLQVILVGNLQRQDQTATHVR